MTQIPTMKRRVMVVDDSLVIRGIMRRLILEEPELDLACLAVNGRQAIEQFRAQKDKVDVIILDIEMPVMDGLTALPELLKINPHIPVIVASTLTLRNADISLKCLELGAKDYIPKPETSSSSNSFEDFKRDLIQKIKSLTPGPLCNTSGFAETRFQSSISLQPLHKGVQPDPSLAGGTCALRPFFRVAPKALVIGCSTGGPQALAEVLKANKGRFTQPLFIAQHMPATFTAMLAEHISKSSGRPAKEGKDGDLVMDGHIYVAPGGFHMTVENDKGQKIIRLNQQPPENFCRPSVNPLLRSVADAYEGRVLGAILTGMGSDGFEGARYLVDKGGAIIAQDEASSVVWGMPAAVAKGGLCSAILPLNRIAVTIERLSNSPAPHLEKVS